MCLPPQLLFGQFKFPITYNLCNKKTGKIRGNVITMTICHIFEPISFSHCAIIAIAIFNYSREPLFVLCDGSLPFQACSFKQLSNLLYKWEKCMLHLEILWNFPFRVVTKKNLVQRYERCLPNFYSLNPLLGFTTYNFVMLGIIFQSVCLEWLYIDNLCLCQMRILDQ